MIIDSRRRPNAYPFTAAIIGLNPLRLEIPQNPSIKSIPGGERLFFFLPKKASVSVQAQSLQFEPFL